MTFQEQLLPSENVVNDASMRWLYWAPRVAGLAFVVFLGIFATDELSRAGDLRTRTLAFSVHLLPAAFALTGLLLAWRREWVGAILFPLLALIYLIGTRGRLDWSAYAVIGGPLLLVGILFGLDWRHRR